ncbi:hypothetical protein [Nitratireductor basaltis]|uniref:Uncharacterized protein n=1 Tax=Nitratireductor basaltis TaxID=472175 RepID=A0A084UDL8_9HYPH|nr:hypothetical protein [Nitratireductor basaltis]KFB11054.1 hypothetical protein EL18_02096 [Nitratireductor basaltis]
MKQEVIIIKEGVVQSLVRDVGTFATFLTLIGVGVLLESSAMQWAGVIIGFFVIAVRATGHAKRHTMTIEQARARLDELAR